MKLFLIIQFFWFGTFCFGQSFEIYNSKSVKEIKSTTYLDLGLFKESDNKNKACCNFIELSGNIISIEKDSIVFQASDIVFQNDFNATNKYFDARYLDNEPRKVIAKNDILYFIDYGSVKQKKAKKSLSILGGLIMVGGLITGINSLFVAGDKRSDLLVVSGFQFVTGLAVGISANPKKKYMKLRDDQWKFR